MVDVSVRSLTRGTQARDDLKKLSSRNAAIRRTIYTKSCVGLHLSARCHGLAPWTPHVRCYKIDIPLPPRCHGLAPWSPHVRCYNPTFDFHPDTTGLPRGILTFAATIRPSTSTQIPRACPR